MKKRDNHFVFLLFLFYNLIFIYIDAGNIAFVQKGVINSDGKISLKDSSTKMILDYDDKIKNHIYLNGGTVSFADDVTFWGPYFFQESGTVALNARELNLGKHQYTLTSTLYFDGGRRGVGIVNVNSFTKLDSTWTFSKCCMLNGNGNTLDISSGQINIERGSMLKIKDIRITGLHNENLNNLDDNCHLMLENVTFDLIGDFDFNCGSAEIENYLDINGTFTFYFDTKNTITIHKNTAVELSKNINFAIRTKDSSGGNQPFYFENSSAELKINSSKLNVGTSGLLLTRGTMGIHGNVDLSIHSTNTTDGLKIGDGTDVGNFNLVFYPASTLSVGKGHFILDCTDANFMQSLSGFSKLKRLAGNIFYIKQNFNMNNLSVYVDSATEMITTNSITARYINSKFMFDGVKFATTSTRYSDGVLLLTGGDNIFIQEGVLPLYSMISGTGNKIRGSGSYQGQIIMSGPGTEVEIGLDGQLLNTIALNYGKVILGRDLEFVGDTCFTGNGIVDLQNNDLIFGTKDLILTSTIYFDGNSGSANLNSKVSLESSWTFSGNCILNGNGNILDLTNTGSLIIERGSKLRIKDIKIVNMHGENINNLDDSCHLIFDNVICELSGDFDFNCGSCEIYNYVDLNGTYTYFLDTSQAIEIHKNTICDISKDLTLAVRTKDTSADNQPFAFEDSSSEIRVNSSRLKIGPAGVVFAKGTMGIHGQTYIDVNSTDSSNGIQLGDGTDAGNFNLVFYPASTLVAGPGYFVIDSTNPNSIQSLSGFSKLYRMAGNVFYVKKDFILSNLSVYLESPTEMIVVEDATASYDNCKFMFDGIKFATTSSRYSDSVLLLGGNDNIFIQEGVLPLYSMISGKGNKIRGSGSYQGQIIMSGPGSELHLGLDGQMLNDVQLNYAKVILDRDVNFARSSFFNGQGIVNLQNKNLKLGSEQQSIDSQIYFDGNHGQISLNSDVNLDTIWTFSDYCTLDGKNHILDLTNSGTLYVERGSTLALKNINIYGLQNENISCVDDSSLIILDNSEFILIKDFYYNRGSCKVYNNVEFHGEHDLYLDTNYTMSIYNHSTFVLNKGITARLRTINTNTDRYPIWFEDNTSEFKINTSNIELGSNGAIFTKGKMSIIGDVKIELNSTDTTNGLQVGDGTKLGDFFMELHPASNFVLGKGDFVIDCYDSANLRSLSSYSKFVRNSGNHFYIKNNFNISNVTMKIDMDTIMDSPDGVDVNFINCNFDVDGINFSTTSKRHEDRSLALCGDDNIYIQDGKMPFNIFVSENNNKISGNGSVNSQITLKDSNSCVDISLDGQVLKSIYLNGGRCCLTKDTNFGQGVELLTTGTMELGSSNLNLGTLDLSSSSTLYVDSSQGSIDFNSMITLSGSWTFSGYTTLNGNGNVLNLKPTANIYIEKGSTLRLSNLRINDLSTKKLQCLDDASTLAIKDCSIMLCNDFEFDTGKLFIDSNFDIKGNYNFIYSTKEQSTINIFTNFKLLPGTTFSYSPQTVNRNLIKFTDLSSKICLYGATLHSTTTGMQLTNGTLEVNNLSYISSDASCKAEGIILGDGIDQNNNVNIDIIAGATLDLISGHMIYKNIN